MNRNVKQHYSQAVAAALGHMLHRPLGCGGLLAGCFGLDIGPKSAQLFADAVAGCKTLFWNGPMGRFEVPGFAAGTAAIARAVSQATDAGATTVVGGGSPLRIVSLNRLDVGAC